MRMTIALSCLLATRAWAGVHDLTSVDESLDLKVKGETLVKYPRVVAGTPALTAEINLRLAASAGVYDVYLGLAKVEGSQHLRDTTCELGLATDGFVSWRCGTLGDDGPMTGGSFHQAWTSNYYIDKGQLRPATLDNVLGAKPDRDAKLEALAGDDGTCHVTIATDIWEVTSDGIGFGSSESSRSCMLTWEVLAPFLVADNPSKRVSQDEAQDHRPSRSAEWATAAPRFVESGEPDSVLDTVTTLVWAAHDNGADLTWQAATTYAAAYRGGGHTDWRLPTESELEALADPEMARRDKTDCTKGKSDLAITKLIHLSCGLAWSSTPFDPSRAVAFGFISGTSRIAKTSEKKNYRALVVRGKARVLK